MATKFHKVSEEQFINDGGEPGVYGDIPLPVRGTAGSAGYDFFAPTELIIRAGESVKVATGIRCEMEQDRCLLIFPRSSLGFKFRLTLDNTVGVIDSDYFGAENQGHIQIKMTNNSENDLKVEKGKAFAQGIFFTYGTTDDDTATQKRKGGFGSTN